MTPLRDRFAALYRLCFPDPNDENPTTLAGTVKGLWFLYVSLPVRKRILRYFGLLPPSRYGRDFWEKNRK